MNISTAMNQDIQHLKHMNLDWNLLISYQNNSILKLRIQILIIYFAWSLLTLTWTPPPPSTTISDQRTPAYGHRNLPEDKNLFFGAKLTFFLTIFYLLLTILEGFVWHSDQSWCEDCQVLYQRYGFC